MTMSGVYIQHWESNTPKEPDPIFLPSLYLPPTLKSSLWDAPLSAIDYQEKKEKTGKNWKVSKCKKNEEWMREREM